VKNKVLIRCVRQSETCVMVEIVDNGPGIEPTHVGRVFDPFFTTKPVGSGTGLGLSICHQIMTALGGTVAVESHPNSRTAFRCLFPIAAETPKASSRPARPEGGRRLRCLVVDDEPNVGSTLRYMLSRSHEAVFVTNGFDAEAELFGPEPYDVVFCDLLMSGKTGMDLFRSVVGKQPEYQRRFVFMTGGACTAEAEAFLASVPNRCLEKPFSFSDAERAIDELSPA
jgi:two-component system cell cycle sensor histidine kinase/response regulator CckA